MHCLRATYADYSFVDGANRTLMLGSGRRTDDYCWNRWGFVSTVELAAALPYTGVPLISLELSEILVGGRNDDLVSADLIWIRLSTGIYQLRIWLSCRESHLRFARRYFVKGKWPRFDTAFNVLGFCVDLTDNTRWPCFRTSDAISFHTFQHRFFGTPA